MTARNSDPAMHFHPTAYRPRPAARCRGARSSTSFLLIACLMVWPAVFATAVIGTFLAAAIYYNDPGGPLFWPLAWIASAIAYALVVGFPLTLCALRRRWYIRLIPAVLAAIPLIWVGIQVGVWSIPATAVVALSILAEASGWRDNWTMRIWNGFTTPWRRHP